MESAMVPLALGDSRGLKAVSSTNEQHILSAAPETTGAKGKKMRFTASGNRDGPSNTNIQTGPSAVLEEEDEYPTDQDEEDEHDAARKVPKISDKRKEQNRLFSAWVQKRAEKVSKEEVAAATGHIDDEALSIRALMSKQESSRIITDPREYQLELFEKAKKENTIAVLDTGSGKTYIAVLLLKHVIDQELENRSMGKKRRISFFLVDCVTLVFQQFDVLETNLDQKVDRFCGEMGCDLWSRETWNKIFTENMVIVCTAEILHQCLMHAFITLDQINLLIFDEAHHTKKSHPYAKIIKDFYDSQEDPAKRPRLFGMTASPVDVRDDPVKAAKNLEAMLHCNIATTSNLALLRSSVTHPDESIAAYQPLGQPHDTPLCSELKDRFGDLEALSRLFTFSHTATSDLGEWCADQIWRFAFVDEEARKVEKQVERKFLADQENRPMAVLDAELERIRQGKSFVEKTLFSPPKHDGISLSSKVSLLHQYLGLRFERPTNAKCIIFVKQRWTARLLGALFAEIGSLHLRVGLLVGTRKGDPGDLKTSVKKQLLTLHKFRKGDLNCLIATSIAEEGLDIPDCNIVIRFDLYSTLIQFIQSRGRARHANSKYIHMVEKGNKWHMQAVLEVRKAEVVMRRFCEALPADRLLQGNEYDLKTALLKEPGHRKYIDPETGATLTYGSSLGVLAHFVNCLPHQGENIQRAAYDVSFEHKSFLCEVILPENSPVHSAFGLPSSKKMVARQSAAFEACCILRQKGHLDKHLLPTYHKVLPQMRNAHLALNANRSSTYMMKIKPRLWEDTRGILPDRLYMTVFELETPENVGRPSQPLAMLTRTRMPNFPPFPLHLQIGKASNLFCTTKATSFEVDPSEISMLNVFTLRLYQDIFNKIFEVNEAEMSYWFAPIISQWKFHDSQGAIKCLIDWVTVKHVNENAGIEWAIDTPHEQLCNRFIVDPWTPGRRFFSIAVEPDMKPLDPVPQDISQKGESILDYSNGMWKKSRGKRVLQADQPVIRAEKVAFRLNFLEEFNEQEKSFNTKSYICLEPMTLSALPVSVVSMGYLVPGIITRLEAYLITMEACSILDLEVKPELALEAFTKDSDNTEEHRAEQIHHQRGMGKNYERLEFIGDCFLKMATSISLFSISPEENEFEYHVRRMLMICNKHLLEVAREKKLYDYIRTAGFSRRTWYPEGIQLLKGKGAGKTKIEVLKHHLGDKTIADVCEAMIGAALLSYTDSENMDMAVKAVTALVASPDHEVSKWADYYPLYVKPKYQLAESTASQLDLAMQVERKHEYHFKYPRLLRSAFIHPSYHFAAEKIPCYQRLEFLGDSLLDMASINFLFHRHPNRDPQWLTEHKMAMVSNKFLAALSVKLEFHKHLRSNTSVIEAQNREYVMEVKEAEKEAKGARDYWTNTKQPPKALSDIVEAYIGAVFVDSEYNFAEVERFFDKQIRWFFEDMSVYDTFANNHPTTYLHNLLTLSFGCTNYRLMSQEIDAIVPGGEPTSIAAVMIHNEFIAEGAASSSKNAKVKASSHALKMLQYLAPFEYRMQYNCNCEGDEKQWVGKDGDGVGMVGTAV